MVRKIEKEDLEWVRAHYGDNTAQACSLSGMEYSVLIEDENGIRDALIATKACFGEAKGIYILECRDIIAKCDYKARSVLLQTIENIAAREGHGFICTSNDAEPVFEENGYKASFPMRKISRNVKRNLWAQADFDGITANKLPILRNKYIAGSFISPTKEGNGAMVTCLYKGGAISAENYGAYALMYRMPQEMLITELFAESETAAMHLIEAAGDYYAREKATILLSCENIIFAGEGIKYHGGMIKLLDRCPDGDISYCGMLFKQ